MHCTAVCWTLFLINPLLCGLWMFLGISFLQLFCVFTIIHYTLSQDPWVSSKHCDWKVFALIVDSILKFEEYLGSKDMSYFTICCPSEVSFSFDDYYLRIIFTDVYFLAVILVRIHLLHLLSAQNLLSTPGCLFVTNLDLVMVIFKPSMFTI